MDHLTSVSLHSDWWSTMMFGSQGISVSQSQCTIITEKPSYFFLPNAVTLVKGHVTLFGEGWEKY